MDAINQVLQILADQFAYDVAKMSEPWMWMWVFPILLYTSFFFVKWMVLTFPFWFPIYMIVDVLRRK